MVPRQGMTVHEEESQTMLRPGRKAQPCFGRGGFCRKDGAGARVMRGSSVGLGENKEIPASSSQEAFDNSRQMFLCPRVRLEARTQVQWAGRTHQHWGQPGSVAAGFRCRRSPGTKPLRNSPALSGDRCMPQTHCQPALETFAKC